MHNSYQSYSVEACNILFTILIEWRAESELLVGLSRCDNPARVQRANRATARFVPRLNSAASASFSNNIAMHRSVDPPGFLIDA